jgi:uncharacterized phage-associated protein
VKEEVYNRFKEYSGSHCWQYEVRKQLFWDDLDSLNLSSSMVASLIFPRMTSRAAITLRALLRSTSGWVKCQRALLIALLLLLER